MRPGQVIQFQEIEPITATVILDNTAEVTQQLSVTRWLSRQLRISKWPVNFGGVMSWEDYLK